MLENCENLLQTTGLQAKIDVPFSASDSNGLCAHFIERSCEAVFFSFSAKRSAQISFHGFFESPYAPTYEVFNGSVVPAMDQVTFHQKMPSLLQSLLCSREGAIVFFASLWKTSDREKFFKKAQNAENGLVALGTIPEKLSERFAFFIPMISLQEEPVWISTPWADRAGRLFPSKVPLGQLSAVDRPRALSRAAETDWVTANFASFFFAKERSQKKFRSLDLDGARLEDVPSMSQRFSLTHRTKIVWVASSRPLLSQMVQSWGGQWLERSLFCDASQSKALLSYLHQEAKVDGGEPMLLFFISLSNDRLESAWEYR